MPRARSLKLNEGENLYKLRVGKKIMGLLTITVEGNNVWVFPELKQADSIGWGKKDA